MEMKQIVPGLPDTRQDVRFLDIHVEGVQQQTEIIQSDRVYQPEARRHRIDQIGLVAVDRL